MNISISISKLKAVPSDPKKEIINDGGFEAEVVEGGCKITDYQRADTELVIPNNICGRPVVALGSCMFGTGMINSDSGVYYGNKTAKSIIVPVSVKKIEQGTFIGCHPEAIHVSEENQHYTSVDGVLFDKKKCELIRYPIERKDKSYTVPNGVKKIRVRAFYGCDFETVSLPDSLERIEDEAFHECHYLKSIDIPAGVSFIGFNAFCNCYSLESVTLPSNNTKIDGCAFWQCSLDKITIPNGVISIGRDVFYGCKISSVEIPSSVITIAGDAFPSETLISFSGEHPTYVIKHGVLFNKQKNSLVRFPSSSKRKVYKVPKGTIEIEAGAFSHCENLQSITLPDSITKIGKGALNMCFSLAEINIPASVTKIGKEAFHCCQSLTSVELPDGITKIAKGMFDWCKSLHSVTIPSSVTKIGDSAFGQCDSLINITIPEGVAKIGNHAFSGCKSLAHIAVPNSVTKLGIYMFEECENLSEISLSSGLTIINSSLLKDCIRLKSIEIPSSVKKICGGAFMGCKNLEHVCLPPCVKEIDPNVFSGCVKLKEVTGNEQFILDSGVLFNADKTLLLQYLCGKNGGYSIPETVTEIQYGAFSFCDKLTNITIPSSVTKLPNSPFRYCTNLVDITVDTENPAYASVDGVLFNKEKTVLLQYPLGQKQTDYTIPGCATKVGTRSFEGSSLEHVIIPAGITEIESGAFFFCKNLKAIDIHAPEDSVKSFFMFKDRETQVNYASHMRC